MIGVLAFSLAVFTQEAPPASEPPRRPDPPTTEAQRLEDERYRVTEGERSTDGSTPDRYICDLRRLPGSNIRVRHCSTVEDRRRARAEAQSVFGYGPAPASANR